MVNFVKIICILSICWTLCNASLLGGLVDVVGDLLVPGGANNVDENLKLCDLQMPDLAEYYSFESDTKSVTTKDGYILSVYCVYNSTALNSTLNPVIAYHGLMDASHTFCLNYPDQSLAFLLANQGYYVCLPNVRGNGFSQGYINASRNSNIPVTVIDAVLEWTGKSKVIYIGHSQGTTTMFALLSSDTSYNDKVSIFAALAPVVYFSHDRSPLFLYGSQIEFLLDAFYGAEFRPHTSIEALVTFLGCTLPTEALCENLLFFLFGYSTHIDESRLPVYMCHSPSNFAWGQFLHYTQLVKVDKFQKYDFGALNMQMYGQPTPPQYNLTKVSAPVALFHSDADLTTANVDVQKLISELSNLVFVQHLNASVAFNHVDYVWAKDAAEIVYFDLIDLIKGY